jgi:hypothetical protein
MTEELKTPDLSSLPLVLVKEIDGTEWKGPYRFLGLGNVGFPMVSVDGVIRSFRIAKPYTPPTRRPMTHADVFAAIRAGAVVRWKYSRDCVFSGWQTEAKISNYEICRSYTGTDSDVWTKMEVDADEKAVMG